MASEQKKGDVEICSRPPRLEDLPAYKNKLITLMLIVRLYASNKCGQFSLIYDGRSWILVHGYVLITTTLGRALEVADEVAKIKGVKNAHAVTGAYDVIATFNVENLAEVADAVVKGIHHIEGVCATQTAICVSCK